LKVLLVTYGSTGDVRPLLALGRALHGKGLRVRICAPPDSQPLIEDTGLRFSPLGSSVRNLMDAQAHRLVGRPLAAMVPMNRILHKELENQFRQLPEEVAAADLVICSGLALAVPSVAEACRVPYHFAASIPALLPSKYHAPLTVPWQNLPGICNLMLWHCARHLLDIGYRPILNRHRRLLGLPPLKHIMAHLTANMMIAADRELAPLPPEAPHDCRQTGYWHLSTKTSLPVAVERFLDQGPPPIYVGFGSMGDPHPQRSVSLLRRSARLAGLRAIIQSGWAGLGFESDAECLCVKASIPHKPLFARVRAAVHHGGAGTTMAAARAGIPQVVVPHLLDQYYWGQRIVQNGLGPPPIPKNKMRVERLARAMRRIAFSSSMRARARTLARPLQQRDGVAEAVRWLTGNGASQARTFP